MKRTTALLLAAILCLCLAACGKAPEPEQSPQEPHTEANDTEGTEEKPQSGSSSPSGNEAEKPEAPVQQSVELVGPWHLDSEKNDLAVFADSLDLFPGYGEWGASMEIRSNGQMSWYIGAAGGCGTYTLEDDVLHGSLVDNIDQKDMAMDLRILVENEKAVLEMDYQDMTIYWAHGDRGDSEALPSGWEKATEDEPWKVTLAEDLFQKYGVLPEYYEDLGDGIYQVYVEVGGELVPFVAVNSATGDYHG